MMLNDQYNDACSFQLRLFLRVQGRVENVDMFEVSPGLGEYPFPLLVKDIPFWYVVNIHFDFLSYDFTVLWKIFLFGGEYSIYFLLAGRCG